MMPGLRINKSTEIALAGGIFTLYFLYFAIFNRYHILYLEQNQLFLFSAVYLEECLSVPGGLSQYAGSFFTQFFIMSWMGAAIVTIHAFAIYSLSGYILKKLKFENAILPFIPVWLLAILQSSELSHFGLSTGFLFLLSFFSFYISVRKSEIRYPVFFIGWPLLYLAAGGFAIPAAFMCGLHELLYGKSGSKIAIFSGYMVTAVIIPFLSGRLFFYIDPQSVYVHPLDAGLQGFYRFSLIILLSLFPLLQLTIYLAGKASLQTAGVLKKTSFLRLIMLLLVPVMIITVMYAHNRKAELMLGMDHHVQGGEWEKVLKLSARYPGYNRLVMYFTNTALCKSGKLAGEMFHYPQAGAQGLKLKWERNSSSFFGGEIFYQLGYTNESARWAFEAMVVKGLNPRSLKKLVLTNLINGDTVVAGKYLNKLDQTLFYRKWSQDHRLLFADDQNNVNEKEIVEKRNLMIRYDFFSNENNLNLSDLLINNPDNLMAYEYMLASLLLEKDLKNFADIIRLIGNYRYDKLPVHFEEALIFYNFSEGVNAVPEGYSISAGTKNRFRKYLDIYTSGEKNAVSELKEKFGDTYWYYIQFTNIPR